MHSSPTVIAIGAIAALVVVGLVIWLIVYLSTKNKTPECNEDETRTVNNGGVDHLGTLSATSHNNNNNNVAKRATSPLALRDEIAHISPLALEAELNKVINAEKFEDYREVKLDEAIKTNPRQVMMTLGDDMVILPVEVIDGEGGWSTMPIPIGPFPTPLPGPVDNIPIGDWVTLPGWGGGNWGDIVFGSPPFNPDGASRQYWITQWRLVVALLNFLRRLRSGQGTDHDRRMASILVRLILLNQRRFVITMMRRQQQQGEGNKIAAELYGAMVLYTRALIRLALLSDKRFAEARKRLESLIANNISVPFKERLGIDGFQEQLTWFTDRAFAEAQYNVPTFTRSPESDAQHVDTLIKITSRAMSGSDSPTIDISIDDMLSIGNDEDLARALAESREEGEAADSQHEPDAPFATPVASTRALDGAQGADGEQSVGAPFATPITETTAMTATARAISDGESPTPAATVE